MKYNLILILACLMQVSSAFAADTLRVSGVDQTPLVVNGQTKDVEIYSFTLSATSILDVSYLEIAVVSDTSAFWNTFTNIRLVIKNECGKQVIQTHSLQASEFHFGKMNAKDGDWFYTPTAEKQYAFIADVKPTAISGKHCLRITDLFTAVSVINPEYMGCIMSWFTDIERCLTISSTTALEKSSPEESIVKVYPNPFTDILTIATSVPGQSKFEILNLSGQVVQTSTFENEVRLDLAHLPAGAYIVRLTDDKGNLKIKKIIKT